MAKQYKWRTTFAYQNEIDPQNRLSYGTIPNTYDSWQTETPNGQKSNTTTYFYRDSNTLYAGYYQDVLSSRVAFNVTQTWTASIDSRNNLTISVHTVVNSVVRDDVQGTDQNTPGREIRVYKEQGGNAYISVTDNQVATAHAISGSVDLGTETFTLTPGQNLTRDSLFIHNQTVGSASYDDIWAGVQFQNPLPPDYRPGTSLDTNTSVWKSHNRVNGACHILSNTDNMTWLECRTQGGAEGEKGDPPLILTAADANSWRNQQLLGKQ